MSVRFVLLRLLLCLALICNGAASAMASARMAMPATAQEHMALPSDPPCHEMAAMDHATDATPAKTPQDGHPAPDCCQSGTCQCACVHAAQVALPSTLALGFVTGGPRIAQPMRAGHSEPALPHLIRPPIG